MTSRSSGPVPEGALAGIRVLELGSSVAAPAAGRLLADLGAEVIKVEPPEGDQLRTWGALAPDGTSWWFKSHNRNKRLVTFDLHHDADVERVRELALQCDVVLENFRPGWLAARGLGYEDLAARKPAIVYASISGYGADGPYASRPGYGNIAEAMGGIRYLTGFADGPPLRVGVSLGDELAGLYTVVGILAALRARDRDGRGDYIDVSLVESCVSLLEGVVPEYVHEGVVAKRNGNRFVRAAPSGVYPTSDGEWIAIGGNGQAIFRRFAAAIGRPELAGDPRFATNQARMQNVAELDEVIMAWTAVRTLADATDILAHAGVPAGPVMSVAEIARDPHLRARGAIGRVRDDDGTEVATPGLVPRLRFHPSRLDRVAGAIGRDQDDVLRELRLVESEAVR